MTRLLSPLLQASLGNAPNAFGGKEFDRISTGEVDCARAFPQGASQEQRRAAWRPYIYGVVITPEIKCTLSPALSTPIPQCALPALVGIVGGIVRIVRIPGIVGIDGIEGIWLVGKLEYLE